MSQERSAANVDQFASHYEALGYTLGTGHLWAPMDVFHAWAERLLGRPILTHEFANPETWVELRSVFEEGAAIRAEGGDDIEF